MAVIINISHTIDRTIRGWSWLNPWQSRPSIWPMNKSQKEDTIWQIVDQSFRPINCHYTPHVHRPFQLAKLRAGLCGSPALPIKDKHFLFIGRLQTPGIKLRKDGIKITSASSGYATWNPAPLWLPLVAYFFSISAAFVFAAFRLWCPVC